MRSKLIITGAIGVLAAATLTVNAENNAQKADQGKALSAVALSARTVSADREEVAIAVPATTTTTAPSAKPEVEESSKPDADVKPATTPALPTACSDAIGTLKSMHQADVAEDAAERTSATTESATTIAADRSEDMTEAQSWAKAVMIAHSACEPQPLVGCQTALSGLQTVLAGLRSQELAEPQGSEMDFQTDFAPVRTAFSAIAMACANRE